MPLCCWEKLGRGTQKHKVRRLGTFCVIGVVFVLFHYHLKMICKAKMDREIQGLVEIQRKREKQEI